jgi:lipoate-protein ligase A
MMMYQNVEPLSPQDRLALEWNLFQSTESGTSTGFCWTWEATRPVVIVGRSHHTAEDVILDACAADGVPVLRRFSGGGTVVLGPGCLNYAVALPLVSQPGLADVAASFRLVLGRIVTALGIPGVAIEGRTDLAIGGKKVSGNAQRRGRRALLQHGTLLYNFDPALALRYLKEPARRPAYRAERNHSAFMGNLPLDRERVQASLASAWTGLVPVWELGVGGWAFERPHMHNGADINHDHPGLFCHQRGRCRSLSR